MTDHPTLWEHVRLRAEARRRHSTAQRKLHQQVTRTRRQARHDLRDARRRTTTTLAVAGARLTELATQALGHH
jgi:hypothetical protein